MNLASLDLNLLVALEALLDEGSVGRAADRVGLSQPAMSHALKRLRALLGDALLVRVGARMQLTSRAEAMRRPVKEALSRVRELLRGEGFEPEHSTRTFGLFASDYAADLLLSALLRRLRREAPGVAIQLLSGRSSFLDAEELARDVDVAITCATQQFRGFYQQRLFVDRDAVAVRRGHPLARGMDVGDFLKAAHVAVVGREFREDPVDSWLREEGQERNVRATVGSYLQALHLAGDSDLIAVIPERLIRAQSRALGIEAIPLPLDPGTFEEYLLHPARAHEDAGSLWLRRILKEIAAEFGPLDTLEARHHSKYRRAKRTGESKARRLRSR